MPTPPAALTFLDFSMRGLTPRWQSTALPATLAGSSESAKQRSASAVATPAAAASAASMISVAFNAPVTDAPVSVNAAPADGVTVAVASKDRAGLSAPTEVIQGTAVGVPTVPGSGPSLPAELATKTPASEAPRKANSTGSMTFDVVPPIE